MTATHSSPTTQSAPVRRTRRAGNGSLLVLQALLVLLGVAALVGGPQLPAPYEAVARLVAPATPLAALIVSLMVVLPRLSGRQQRQRTKQTLAWIESLHVCAGPVEHRAPATVTEEVGPEVAAAEDPASDVSRRVLEMQVRSLEAALEQEQQRTQDVRRTVEGQLAVAGRHDQERALLAVQALRDVLAQESGLAAANRLAAVLSRIGAAPSFTRPVLPSGRSTNRTIRLASPPAPAQVPDAAVSDPSTAPVPGPSVAATRAQAAAPAPAQATPSAEAPSTEAPVPSSATPEVPTGPAPVLPVPAPRPAGQSARPRRGLRRGVSA